MNKKRFAVVILCFVVSVFCLTVSSCGDRFGTDMYLQCYVIVPKEYTKMICTTTRTVDSDYLDKELMPRKFSEVAWYDLEKILTEAYPEDKNNLFYFNVEEKYFSSTETYVLDLEYQFYDEKEKVTECSQNIEIPLKNNAETQYPLVVSISNGILFIKSSYSQSI